MISEAGATLRVARLERLLERVRVNAGKPRPARLVTRVSTPPASMRGDEPEIDYDDFADAEIVEIDVDEPSMAPAVPADAVRASAQPRASASPTAYSMSFVDEGLPDGISPLREGGETLARGVVSSNPPAVFGHEDTGLALHSPQHSEPPTWQADTAQPTMEQLGNTIGLESGLQGPALELDVQSVPPAEADELEVTLPTRGFAGGYDEGLASPETAQRDLAEYSGGAFGGFDDRVADAPSAQGGYENNDAFGAGGAFDNTAYDGAAELERATAFDTASALGGGTFGGGAFDASSSAVDEGGALEAAAVAAPAPASQQTAHVVQRTAVNPAVPVAEIVDNRAASTPSFVALLDESISLISR